MTEQNNSIRPECNCCFPPQQLTVTGQRAFCPITERIYDAAPPPVDFYPGRQKRRGEVAPFAINPAEDRFGAREQEQPLRVGQAVIRAGQRRVGPGHVDR